MRLCSERCFQDNQRLLCVSINGSGPAVTLGRFQSVDRTVDMAAAEQAHAPVYRRDNRRTRNRTRRRPDCFPWPADVTTLARQPVRRSQISTHELTEAFRIAFENCDVRSEPGASIACGSSTHDGDCFATALQCRPGGAGYRSEASGRCDAPEAGIT